MTDVTEILSRIESGDRIAADELLPVVYQELRRLAAAKLSNEQPGQTFQATALVHEAYLRLIGEDTNRPTWNSRGHFFSAAAEAMRRILVEIARRKQSLKHGGGLARHALTEEPPDSSRQDPIETIAVHELLDRLAKDHPRKAQVVKLRFFCGFTQGETAQILSISDDSAQDDWVFARAWLKREWRKEVGEP